MQQSPRFLLNAGFGLGRSMWGQFKWNDLCCNPKGDLLESFLAGNCKLALARTLTCNIHSVPHCRTVVKPVSRNNRLSDLQFEQNRLYFNCFAMSLLQWLKNRTLYEIWPEVETAWVPVFTESLEVGEGSTVLSDSYAKNPEFPHWILWKVLLPQERRKKKSSRSKNAMRVGEDFHINPGFLHCILWTALIPHPHPTPKRDAGWWWDSPCIILFYVGGFFRWSLIGICSVFLMIL